MSGQKGLTLLETLIVVAIIAVLTGVSAPEIRRIVTQQEGDKVLRTLSELLTLARSTAVTRGQMVTLCRSIDGQTCSGTWTFGAIVFTDRNGDHVINQDDKLLRAHFNRAMQGAVVWRAFQNRQYLQIDAQGFLRHQSGHFLYCPADLDVTLARQLIVNGTGRFRFGVDSDGDNIREDSNGDPLRC